MRKKVKPGKLRGNTFRMVMEKGIEMSLMGNNGRLLKATRLIVSDIQLTCV